MELKVSLNGALFFVYTFTIMFGGMLAEFISAFCLVSIAIIERKKIKQIIGNVNYSVLALTIIFFFFMCYMQHKMGNVKTDEIIRIIGLTKGICAPALFLLSFSTTAKRDECLNLLIYIMIGLNILYSIQTIMKIEWLSDFFVLGSVNGCAGASVVMLAVIVTQIQKCRRALHIKEGLFIITAYINILTTGSDTAFILCILETMMFLIMSRRMRLFFSTKGRKLISAIIATAMIGAMVVIYFIANGTIKIDSYALGTRVAIWRQAFKQFSLESSNNRLFGTGNDYVQMMSQRLEAHNFLIEILLTYGCVGLVVFLLSAFIIIKGIIKRVKVDTYDLLFPVFVYVIICMMHPFFTGVFLFQWICISAILYVAMNALKNKEMLI